MFKLFAELIAFHLAAHERLAASEASLSGERQNSGLREQFIAVLGHDLRNPLASIDAGARLLQKTPLNEKATSIVTMMQDSVRRMAKIIDNVMDLARGRLGGGIALNRAREPLAPVLDQVIAEARLTHPERAIEVVFDLAAPVDCDRSRIARLFSNLLGNALLYGKADAPVTVRASTREGRFRAVGRQRRRSDPGRRARAPVPAVRARRRAAEPAGVGPRALHRVADRARAWRHARRDVDAGRDALHVPHAFG